MNVIARLRSFISAVVLRRRMERDLDAELQFHVETRANDLMARGLPRAEAERRARTELGDTGRWKEEARDALGLRFLDELRADLRYGVRGLVRSPGFTSVAVLSLALGIGANIAIFSVVDAVLLRPLAYPAPDRLVSFAWPFPSGMSPANVSPLTFQYWHDQSRAFDGFAAASSDSVNMVSGSVVERVRSVAGTADLFRVIGVFPGLGRGFVADDCVPGGPFVTVIGFGLWQRVFGGAPDAIGKSITLNDRPYTVIGVMPANFTPEPAADLFYPLQLRVDPRDRGRNYEVLGRLRRGMTLEQAQSETDRLFQHFQADNREHVPRNVHTIGLIRYQDFLVAGIRPLLQMLLGAVGLVLVIACSNVANLLLARSAARQREIAIRSALGASMTRLTRQVVTESLLLSLTGGMVGVAVAALGVRSLAAWIPGELPRLRLVTVDDRVLGFALMMSVLVGIAFGLLGVIRLLKSDPIGALKAAAGTGVDVLRRRLSNALVVGQVGLSVILLIGAGLLAVTFMNLRGTRVGFDTQNIVIVQLPMSSAKFESPGAIARLDRELVERISAIPGVVSATTASSIPLERGPNSIFGIEGQPPEQINYVELRPVGPDYLRTLGIPLRAGRGPRGSDAQGALPVVVVNEMLARLFGSPALALGHRVIVGRTTEHEDVPREIVGVVSDVADGRPGTRLFPTLYMARSQFSGGEGATAVLVRTNGKTEISSALRRVIRAVDVQLPITQIRSMTDVASTAVAQQRFNMILIGLFAGVASLLTMVGLYGLLSYQVAQRTRDIGVRMALGARRMDVQRMIVAQGFMLTLVGLTIGVAGSLGLGRFLRTLLFGVTPTSPGVFIAVASVLFVAAFLASVIPARRAMRVDPVIALRYE
jgi:putative ABC transport system permease protein